MENEHHFPHENNNAENQVIPKEVVEHRQYMRQLIISEFQDSILYKRYEELGRLHELFTDKILDMREGKEYTAKEVCEICETERYNLNNKRPVFWEYMKPVMESPDTRHWRHDWKGVFKFKMIDGLTGQGGEYSLKQLKVLVYGRKDDGDGGTPEAEQMHRFVSLQERVVNEIGVEKFTQAFKILTDPDIVDELLSLRGLRETITEQQKYLLGPVEEVTERINSLEEQVTVLLEQSQNSLEAIKTECEEILALLEKEGATLADKKVYIERFSSLEKKYPENLSLILVYKGFAQSKMSSLEEVSYREVKDRAIKLHEKVTNDSLSTSERIAAYDELEILIQRNPGYASDLYVLLATAKTQTRLIREGEVTTKPSFWKRLFGGKGS